MASYQITQNIAMIRQARREGAALRAQREAAAKERNYKAIVAANFAKFFVVLAEVVEAEVAKEEAHDFSALLAITCGDYQKWLRRTIRSLGRNAEVGNAQHSPIDMFVKQATGLDFILIAGGDIEVTINNTRYQFTSAAVNLDYYLFDENGDMIVSAGKALEVAMYEDASTMLVAA